MTDDLLKGNLNKKRNSETYLERVKSPDWQSSSHIFRRKLAPTSRVWLQKIEKFSFEHVIPRMGIINQHQTINKDNRIHLTSSYLCQIQSAHCLGGGRIWEDWTKKHVSVKNLSIYNLKPHQQV